MYGLEGTIVGGDFRIERLLGRGGMGSVYVATQVSTNRQRALKLMSPELAQDERSRARFAEEARVRGRVHSVHIVETIGAGVDERLGAPWIAMELLEGETLAARISRAGPLPAQEARRFLGELAAGLAAAHRAGIAHRDIKPENVFIATQLGSAWPVVKLLDFGIAKEVGSLATAPTASVGSPAWMAPEQANGEPITPATDVWAYGLVTFCALTGTMYWRAPRSPNGTVSQLLQEILLEALPPASSRAPGMLLPHGFDAWFARCVSRDPTQRIADADEAWAGLDRVLAQAPHTAGLPAPRAAAAVGVGDATLPAAVGSTTAAVQATVRPTPGRAGVSWPALVVVSVLVLAAGGAALFLAGRDADSDEVSATDADAEMEGEERPAKRRRKSEDPEKVAPPAPAPAPSSSSSSSLPPEPQPHGPRRSGDATEAEHAKFAEVCARCAKNLPAGGSQRFLVTVSGAGSYAVTPKDDRVAPCLVTHTSASIGADRDKVKNFVCDAVGPRR